MKTAPALALLASTLFCAAAGAAADISVTQTATPSPVSVGKDLLYTATITNNGPDPVSFLHILWNLPANSTLVFNHTPCPTFSVTLDCAPAMSMPAGSSVVMHAVVRFGIAGTGTSDLSVNELLVPDPASGNNSSTLGVTVDAAGPVAAVPRFRLYSVFTREHLHTTDANEYNTLGSYAGTWVQEGIAGYVLDNPGSFNGVAAVPYYRLYNDWTLFHYWTKDPNEYYTLSLVAAHNGVPIVADWRGEGVDGYVLPGPAAGAAPLYQLRYPFIPELRHWTIDANEYATLIASYGWIADGGSVYLIQ